MVRLRHPRYGDFIGLEPDHRLRGSRNHLRYGRLCDGCRWSEWCRRFSVCWAAEKADIAAERLEPKPDPRWAGNAYRLKPLK